MAIDLMIDKEALLQGALWGEGRTTASPSYPTSSSYNSALKNRAQDIEKAKALLAEAGYGPGKLDVVFKATTNYPYHVESAQIMLEWFKEAGVNMKIEQLTWADWLSQVWVNKDFQISMMNFFTLWEPDFLYYSLWNSTGAFNYRKIKDPVIDELTQKARVTIDPAARAEIYKQVQQRIFDQTHDVILWFRNGSIGAQPSRRRARHDRPSQRQQPQLPQSLAARLTLRSGASTRQASAPLDPPGARMTYVLNRLLSILLTLFLISVITFAVTSDPARRCGDDDHGHAEQSRSARGLAEDRSGSTIRWSCNMAAGSSAW